MRGTMRAFDPAIRQQLLSAIRRITEEGCRALGAEGTLIHDVGTPAIHNHPDLRTGSPALWRRPSAESTFR